MLQVSETEDKFRTQLQGRMGNLGYSSASESEAEKSDSASISGKDAFGKVTRGGPLLRLKKEQARIAEAAEQVKKQLRVGEGGGIMSQLGAKMSVIAESRSKDGKDDDEGYEGEGEWE